MNPLTIALVNQAAAQAEKSAVEAKAFAEKIARVAEAMPGTNGGEYHPFMVDLARALLPLDVCLVHKNCIKDLLEMIDTLKPFEGEEQTLARALELTLQRALNGGL